ncbi:MAG: carotenoid 1,2-hydratase [Planctomycetes bacterium]|nr:carotenoid 1,2-hydratase [Planctomycetota bacterium]
MTPLRLRLLLRAPLVLALLFFVAVFAWQLARRPTGERPARLSPIAALGAEADPAFERALAPRDFEFPRDHGPHPTFQTEWWYFTGHLANDVGRRFGFELTFFRRALAHDAPGGKSAWAARDVYMAHFALTDEARGRFVAAERFERGALDLADSRAEPWSVWVGPWSAESRGAAFLPLVLRAATERAGLELELAPSERIVPHGDRGLSRKGSEAGNASYYYSVPRIAARGTFALDGETHAVRGEAWLDREWSTSALEPGVVGWDWFALTLDDGRALMLYRLRRADGSGAPASAGTWIERDGTRRELALADFELETLATWRSPHTGAEYPSRWRVRVPSTGVDLELAPWVADQELALAFPYWEGACDVLASGERVGRVGRAYVELVGYAPVASDSASRAAR